MQKGKEKILTVSVAAYNMSAYIAQCLDSCMCGDLMEKLEVLVVDDGSKDDTGEIAERYVAKYPSTFRLLRKENGGYGSTVNLSMSVAQGKYFRLLDADDWFAAGSLEILLPVLEDCDDDLIVTPMYRCVEGEEPRLMADTFGFGPNETVDAGSLTLGAYMSMWRMTARTDLLRAQPFELPEHCVFTDQLFVANCLARCESIRFADCPLYCYRLGRDGQTVAPESRIAHYSEMEKVVLTEIAVFEGVEQEEARRAMLGTIATHYSTHLKLLVMLPRSIDNYRKIRGFERLLRRDAPELYEAAGRVRKLTRMLRKSRYVVYWPLTMLDLKQRKYWEV